MCAFEKHVEPEPMCKEGKQEVGWGWIIWRQKQSSPLALFGKGQRPLGVCLLKGWWKYSFSYLIPRTMQNTHSKQDTVPIFQDFPFHRLGRGPWYIYIKQLIQGKWWSSIWKGTSNFKRNCKLWIITIFMMWSESWGLVFLSPTLLKNVYSEKEDDKRHINGTCIHLLALLISHFYELCPLKNK